MRGPVRAGMAARKHASFGNQRVNATPMRCIGICSRQFETAADRITRRPEFAAIEAPEASGQNDF
jgi:hypothetical protein